ncbi:WSC domain-containing protein [Coniochaeta sp. 2T2.1]|nr:WSC domain-containing protein [Coniochaeta sp. 2T2.1]
MLLRTMAVMVVAVVPLGECLASTDTITWGGDNSRAGYFSNNNMDPAVVTSSEFGQVFKVQLPGDYLGQKEKIFSQPLIYTPKNGDGTQYVYWATAQNNVYKMNAKTGEVLASRNLHIPFMSADLSGENQQTPGYCQDINPTVGIIGTGVIDPDTDTLYLTAKTYEDQTKVGVPQGRPAGRIYIHALDVNDLSERPNFPFHFEGLGARNNPPRLFNGGIQNQRPGLLQPKGSDFIYAGFGSHCVNYNFTGWVVGWHKTTGEIVEHYATQGEGIDSPKKGASLWMSGGGIASDNKGSMFFATGNGYGGQVGDIPINRGSPPTSLEEAVVHMTYDNSNGRVSVADFYMPANKGYLDGGDLDLGTSPLAMLPSDPFTCGDIKRMGVVTGKDHVSHFLNLDDLGGYKTGPNRGNRILGSYMNENSVYAGVGVYPLEGGYVYVNVIGFKTRVFKFSCQNGVPSFTPVGESGEGKNGFGVSHGTVTTLNGQSGTGLFWVTDVDNANPQGYSLRIYEAVPTGGLLKLVKGFNVPAINKFTRPHFGDGIVYFGTSTGIVYAYGAPTNPGLNCTAGPINFGTVGIGAQSTPTTVTCTAKIALTVTNSSLSSPHFTVAGLPAFPRQLAAGAVFSFTATFAPTTYGDLSGSIAFTTTNNAGGFSKTTSIRLSGTGESADALLAVTPDRITFNQVVVGSDTSLDSVILSNPGKAVLNIQSIEFSEVGLTGPFAPANVTGTEAQFGLFTLSNLPSTIAASSQQLVTVGFNPATNGNHSLFVKITSNGGTAGITITASAGASPVALIQLEKPDGTGWQTWTLGSTAFMSFGNVTQNTERRLRFRITNTAPAGSVPLEVPISKPPFGIPGIISTANSADIGEGTIIKAGEYAEAYIVCTVPKTQWNTDPYTNVTSWVFNTNDRTLGKFEVPFTCTAVAQQGGPLKEDGQGKYRYAGCWRENFPSGRQLKSQLYGDNNNTADMCLKACEAKGFQYCGMQYHRECWGGPTPPSVQASDLACNFDCSGDIDQWCGGDGIGATTGNPHISLFATNATIIPSNPGGPFVNPGVNGYVSIGCYTESTTGRALSNGVSTGGVKTVAACINACALRDYKYVGLEYGGECWCANQFTAGSVPTAITQCSMTCGDNTTEYCGAGSRLNVYQKESTTSTSSSSSVVLPTGSSSTSSTSLSSTSLSSTVITTGTSTSSAISSSTTSSSTISTSITTTSSTAPTSTSIRQTVGAYKYQGCYTETTQGGRSLNGKSYYDDLMTLEKCAAACSAFTYWGTEYTRECYCGNNLNGNSALDVDQTKCNLLCKGDTSQYCGGASRFSLYKYDPVSPSVSSTSTSSSLTSSSTSVSSTSTPATSTTSTSTSSSATTAPTLSHKSKVGGYSLVGCWAEGQGIRALTGATYADDTMTLEMCAANCAGFAYWGTEYGRECYCGMALDITSVAAPLEDCNMVCGGNEYQYCGAGNRLELYSNVGQSSGSSSSSSVSTASSSSTSTSTSVVPTTTSSSSSSTSTSTSESSTTTSSTASSTSSSTSSATSESTTSTSTTSSVPETTSSTSSTTTSTTPSATPLWPGNANFTYYGCVAEPSSGRLLARQVINLADMTQDKCMEACWMYKYAGIEYGKECWCGMSSGDTKNGEINWAGATGATPGFNATESDCNKPCPGNSTQRCGAGKRLNLFVHR